MTFFKALLITIPVLKKRGTKLTAETICTCVKFLSDDVSVQADAPSEPHSASRLPLKIHSFPPRALGAAPRHSISSPFI